jgi:hypothetical protein
MFGCLLMLAYYTFSMWYEFRERRWNYILTGENRRTGRIPSPNVTFSITNPTWIDPGAKPGLRVRGRRLTTWAIARPLTDIFLLNFCIWLLIFALTGYCYGVVRFMRWLLFTDLSCTPSEILIITYSSTRVLFWFQQRHLVAKRKKLGEKVS